MAVAPSQTAEATRLIEPWRTSPAAKTPSRLVPVAAGARSGGQPGGACVAEQVAAGHYEALIVVPGLVGEPAGVGLGADQDEQRRRRRGFGRAGHVVATGCGVTRNWSRQQNTASGSTLQRLFRLVAGAPIAMLAPTGPEPVVLDGVLVLTWKPGRRPARPQGSNRDTINHSGSLTTTRDMDGRPADTRARIHRHQSCVPFSRGVRRP